MAKKKITQLDPATSVNSDALFPLSQEDNNEAKTFKGTIEQLGDYINKSQDFNDLNTTSKKVIGAINEVLASGGGGGDIISSVTTPAPIMTFNDGGDSIPVNKLLVAVTAQQAGTGTPAPDNVRAISGHSQAVISVTNDTITTKWGMEQGTINSSGNNQVGTTRLRTINNTPIEASTTYNYKIGGSSNLDLYRLFEYDANGGVTYSAPSETSGSFTTASTTVAFRILIRYKDNATITLDDLESIQITKQQAKGTVVTTIPFGSTYYGGTLDVTNGKLTVTHGIKTFTGDSSETWNKYTVAQGNLFRIQNNGNKVITAINTYCNRFAPVYYTDRANYTVSCNSDGNFDFINNDCSDETEWKSFLANNNVDIVYELETPVIINLTPAQITTLSGSNNIYANCGDIQSLEYFNENADDIAELHRSLSDDFHIYSTAEQIVGKWIDGSDIYEKTWDFGSDISISYNSWTNTSILNDNFAVIVSAICRTNTGSYVGDAMVNISGSTYIQLQTPRNNNNIGVRYLTLRYTKTS